MSEPVEQLENQEQPKQAWINVWIDADGGLGFEGNSASTTQLLGMVAMAHQLIIQKALSQNGDSVKPAETE